MDFDISQLEDVVIYTHFAGLCITITCVVFADLLGIWLLFSTRHRPRANDFEWLHSFVLLGLVLVWIPTFAFAAMHYTPSGIPPVVYMNFAVAGLLSINSMLIRSQVVPLARYRYRPLVLALSFRNLSGTLTLASFSFVCWLFALSIALHGFLHELTIRDLAARVPPIWAGFLIALYFVVILIRGLWTIDRAPKRH
jgi:hypothetical protein